VLCVCVVCVCVCVCVCACVWCRIVKLVFSGSKASMKCVKVCKPSNCLKILMYNFEKGALEIP
jgi:hypothetical protein